ncbi:MAG TPA: aldehyde dehydrogenase family protein, partial [Bacteroidia bacterium]|nr:aldehyde dehydrogenase family protein [Bacteroidia bacterium]
MKDTVVEKDYGIAQVLKQLGIAQINKGAATGSKWITTKGKTIDSYSPVDGQKIGSVDAATADDYATVMKTAEEAFKVWRLMPAPKRGEIVLQMGDELRKYKEPLGKLVSFEMGKSLQEGLGEVQEMIDICDF